MATSTYMTFLMHKSADAADWEKLLDFSLTWAVTLRCWTPPPSPTA